MASNTPEEHDEEARRICSSCVGDSFLRKKIDDEGEEALCYYCKGERKTFSIDQLADEIETAFESHYARTSPDPDGYESAMLSDRESSYEWERHGEEVLWAIAEAANIDQEPAEDVLSVLEDRHSDWESAKMGEECPFDKNSYYELKDHDCGEFTAKWSAFERGLKTEARYFSRSAQATLNEIFADLPFSLASNGAPAITTIGPDASLKFLYRARVFAAEEEKLVEALKYPWRHLGPPPMHAASAGRMNARGISVFYGAVEAATAMAEVRPPVGSQVAVAKFAITRPLRLLNLDALKSLTPSGSIFDPKYLREIQRAKFMEILSRRIARPVMPTEEAFEYLATQAVADYLATEQNLDGIVFPSVQVGHASLNVVLFHHAARVEEVQLPVGTQLTARLDEYDDEGAHPNYSVWEEVPPTPAATPSSSDPLNFHFLPMPDEAFNARQVSLKIDLASITVQHINAVSFSADEYSVDRYRTEKRESSHF